MRINIPKFNEASSGGEPIPAAVYPVTITRAELKTPKSGGEDMIAIEFTVADGEYAKRKLFRNFSLAEKALGFLKELCEKAEVEFDDEGFDTEDLLGNELKLQVGQEEYEGRVVSRVEKIYKAE